MQPLVVDLLATRKIRTINSCAGGCSRYREKGDASKDISEAITLFFDKCLRRQDCKIKDTYPQACDTCYHAKPAGEYVYMLYSLHLLVTAGYPFGADTLPLEVWRDLGLFRQAIMARMRGI